MYSYKSRIRYSELDETGHLRLESLLDYFQDCSTFHSEDIGLGVDYLREQHLVWVLSSWQIVVERYPGLGESVVIGTVPYEIKGFIGFRNFLMTDEKGNRLAYANTLWSLLDTQTGKPAKPLEKMLKGYVLEPKLEMEKVLFAADELTGLIWSCALMRPSKSTMDMEVKSLKKKFKDKKFAAGCSREVITQGAEMLGWELDELFDKTILAMRSCEAAVAEAMEQNS